MGLSRNGGWQKKVASLKAGFSVTLLFETDPDGTIYRPFEQMRIPSSFFWGHQRRRENSPNEMEVLLDIPSGYD